MIGKKNPFSYNNTRSNKDLNSLFKNCIGIISNIEKTRKTNKKEESRLNKQKIAYQKSLLSLEKNKIKQEELRRELDL